MILGALGSCLPRARFYNRLADAAVRVGDIDLYAAPNGGLRARRTARGWQELAGQVWPFSRRTIIFFGDFDGGDAVVETSWSNRTGCAPKAAGTRPWLSIRGAPIPCLISREFIITAMPKTIFCASGEKSGKRLSIITRLFWRDECARRYTVFVSCAPSAARSG